MQTASLIRHFAVAAILAASAHAKADCALFRSGLETDEVPSGAAIANLNDGFDAPLANWNILNPSAFNLSVANSELRLEVPHLALWFNGSTGGLVYRLIEGNFKATSTLRTRKASDPNQLPTLNVELAGLMAHDPNTSSGQNYVFIVMGFDTSGISVETKTTVNSASTFSGTPFPGAAGDLRVCRVGSEFRLYARAPLGTWQLKQTFTRADLACSLQVGPVAYTAQSTPDMAGYFEYFNFDPVATTAQCDQD